MHSIQVVLLRVQFKVYFNNTLWKKTHRGLIDFENWNFLPAG